MRRALFVAALVCLGVSACWAQDPVKVDPQHYKVELENAKVRVLRVHYGPHEKSVMHYHPNLVAVFLTDGQVKMTYPDGKTEDIQAKAGQTQWTKAEKHLPENTGDNAFDVILVEMKAKPAPKAAAKPPAK
jgi:quercetin dioxygenase-like cupin family protein